MYATPELVKSITGKVEASDELAQYTDGHPAIRHFRRGQKVTYGSFNTQSYVTTLQSGAIAPLHGAKLMLNFDERLSDGELSYAKGEAFNQMAKLVVPVTDKLIITGYTAFNYTRYFQTDNGAGFGMGVTPEQPLRRTLLQIQSGQETHRFQLHRRQVGRRRRADGGRPDLRLLLFKPYLFGPGGERPGQSEFRAGDLAEFGASRRRESHLHRRLCEA